MKLKLLGVGTNAKTIKGDGDEYLTAIMYMTPWKILIDGMARNSCPMAEEAGCVEACLNTAGRGAMNVVQSARQRKAEWFYRDRDAFMEQLRQDITSFEKYCTKRGIQPVVRLNGTTDIRWESIKIAGYTTIFELFPNVQFYDYTKISNRKTKHIANYHLTWSYSGAKQSYADKLDSAIEAGMNVAVVFRKPVEIKGNAWRNLPVVDGDADDLRILDPKGGHAVALYAKGKAKKDTSGFVIDIVEAEWSRKLAEYA